MNGDDYSSYTTDEDDGYTSSYYSYDDYSSYYSSEADGSNYYSSSYGETNYATSYDAETDTSYDYSWLVNLAAKGSSGAGIDLTWFAVGTVAAIPVALCIANAQRKRVADAPDTFMTKAAQVKAPLI